MVKKIQIAPSVLAADYTQLGAELRNVADAGADYIHLDVMDGHFVPNISFGADVIKALRPLTDLYFDVHLMIANPMDYIDMFADAGANGITIHVEAMWNLQPGLDKIKNAGCDVGVAVNPDTSFDKIAEPLWANIDRLTVMTVEPGFGGQKFIPLTDKIAQAARIKENLQPALDIQIDGGINTQTASVATQAGATTLVAGSAIFKTDDYKTAIATLREAALS